MPLLPLDDARRVVLHEARPEDPYLRTEMVPLEGALGRVLAEEIRADRDAPPFHRSTRDGYAVASADCGTAGARLRITGEIAAGDISALTVARGSCVEIMTGAPMPSGADAVVMIEDTAREGGEVVIRATARAGDNIVPAGAEIRHGDVAIRRGTRLDPSSTAVLAQMGHGYVPVVAVPRVAVLPTGNEIVGVDQQPGPAQIRNSNGYGLAAQALRAGAIPLRLDIGRDDRDRLKEIVEDGLARADILVLCGGISKGKHDLVDQVLDGLGAQWLFRGVAIRPGKPVAFGRVDRKLFFALPGNPVSSAVTFELFVRPAIDLRSGIVDPGVRTTTASLATDFTQAAVKMTAFVPALLRRGWSGVSCEPLASQGSGDTVSLARAQAFLVVPPGVEGYRAGETVTLLLK